MTKKFIDLNTSDIRVLDFNKKSQIRIPLDPKPEYDLSSNGKDIVWKYGGKEYKKQSSLKRFFKDCPLGSVGDYLYVREPFSIDGADVKYYATDIDAKDPPLSANIMTEKDCRFCLKIKGARLESLQDIDLAGMKAEGYDHLLFDSSPRKEVSEAMFIYFWNLEHASDHWQENPLVCVIDFKRELLKSN